MNWNDAAEDFLNQVLQQTPRPSATTPRRSCAGLSEAMAEEDGKNRVGVETVHRGMGAHHPESLRPDLPRQMERFASTPTSTAIC